jgi:hypothetical protein
MTVTEKLDQAELSISSWDSSEWAPHAVETVAVKARKSRVRALPLGNSSKSQASSMIPMEPRSRHHVAHNAVRGSYPGLASLATLLVGRQLLCADRAPELAAT